MFQKHAVIALISSVFVFTTLLAHPFEPLRRGPSGSSSESTFYLKGSLGYNFKFLSNYGTNSSGDNNGSTNERISYSLGNGIRPDIGFGVNITENIGVELDLSYLMGMEQTYTSSSSTSLNTVNSSTGTYKASMLNITPLLVLRGSGDIKPYVMAGPMFGLFPKFTGVSSSSSSSGSESSSTYKYDGGMALGIKVAIGVEFPLSENLSLFGEGVLIAMNYAPTLRTLTARTSNNTDVDLSTYKTNSLQTQYVDSYDSPVPFDVNQPATSLKSNYSVSSIGLNLGVKWNF